jgi:RNA polymerase sigma-70 factor (ECF subfamily)
VNPPGQIAARMRYPHERGHGLVQARRSGSPVPVERLSTAKESAAIPIPGLLPNLVQDLWRAAEAETCEHCVEELSIVLRSVGERANDGLPPGVVAYSASKGALFHPLHLTERALAHACALGREAAWKISLSRYRTSLMQAAVSLTVSV